MSDLVGNLSFSRDEAHLNTCFQILHSKASEKDKQDLLSGYHMLTDPDQMGERFKFFALLNKDRKDKPAGFTALK